MKSLILGHKGMLGSALHRLMPDAATLPRSWDLRRDLHYPDGAFDVVYLCAARVGGIGRNLAEPGQMIYDNLMIQSNCIEAARQAGVKLFVLMSSSCIYPALDRPIREDNLMTGPLESSNAPYAMAKLAGIHMLSAYAKQYGMQFLVPMPCNLYGPGDNYEPEQSHFLAAMIRKFHEAKVKEKDVVYLWGDGSPRRELMHVDDCARIITELVGKGARGLVNVGWGSDTPIREWAQLVKNILGFETAVQWDNSKPNGVARKLLDVSRMRSFGCAPTITPEVGIREAYNDFLSRYASQKSAA